MPKLLIIEDNKLLLSALQRLAQHSHQSFSFHIYSSAAQALLDLKNEQLTIEDGDFVITDNGLPNGESGLDFIDQFNSTFNQDGDVMIILMSGARKPQNLPENVIFLAKPFDLSELEEIIGLTFFADIEEKTTP